MMQLINNTELSQTQHAARMNALQSFTFFANHLMGLNVPTETCEIIQELVEDEEDVNIPYRRPLDLAKAMFAWLNARGVCTTALFPMTMPQSEVLSFVGLDCLFNERSSEDIYALLDVQDDCVILRWV